jgi:ATP-dependent Lhr-like helicase
MEGRGRWALVRRSIATKHKEQSVEHVARTLLARYGVVFWRLLEREAAWLPPWRELLKAYRRLESRGEIRGGRFVTGFSGEQFALPDAIGLLRAIRKQAGTDQVVSISGADPLNLVGILTPGPKLPALVGNRVLYRNGIPIAVLVAGDVRFMESLQKSTEWTIQNALLRGDLDIDSASIVPNDPEQAVEAEAYIES